MESIGQRQAPAELEQEADAGALIVQKGGRKGLRRPLGVPLTFIGRDRSCDICLNVEGIGQLHCVLVHGADGLIIRDLESKGTYVNGKAISNARLNEGDVLAVGPFEFVVKLPQQPASESFPGENEALRLQAAAVAAQQTALCEDEIKLQQRLGALEQQKEQLATHLEDKRRRLVQLNQKAQSERAALHHDRVSYEKYIEKITSDLSLAQRELLESQQHLQGERKQLSEFNKKLKERWRREFDAERRRLQQIEEELGNESANISEEQKELLQRARAVLQEQLRTNTDYEMKRRHLRDAWIKVREAQHSFRKRRSEERAALRVRELDVERCELGAIEIRNALREEARNWEQQRRKLEEEVEGLQNRLKNQRLKLHDQQREIERLQSAPQAALQEPTDDATETAETPAAIHDELVEQRRTELDQIASELADQRVHLAEQWQRLLASQQRFRQDHLRMLDEVQVVVGQLACQEEELGQREQARQEAERELRLKHEEMLQLRQHLVAWRARLRVHETAWEGKRNQLLAEVRAREELAENQLQALVEIRQRWAKRRRKELEQVRGERQAVDRERRNFTEQQQQLDARAARVEDDRRLLAEKALAFEQYRQQFLSRGGENPAAERRIERLRRRWVSQNANIVRAILRERENLQTEAATLEEKHAELQKKADSIAGIEASLVEKQTAWEHKQILAASRQARMQQEIQKTANQHAVTESQLGKMQDEVERIAKTLLSEPEAPAILREAA